MSSDSIGLIRRLAGGVKPIDPVDLPGPTDRIGSDFRSMLEDARRGVLRSGAPVRVAPALANSLDAGTLDQLAAAADSAAAEGITRALVQIEERMFRLDVPARTVVDSPESGAEVIPGIDGLVRVMDHSTSAPDSRPDPSPARVVRNASLINALSGIPGGD